MTELLWPRSYAQFYRSVQINKVKLLTGTVLAIDPSSGGTSQPGYAFFKNGKLEFAGELKLPSKKLVYHRLEEMYDILQKLLPERPDVLIVEQIRGSTAHQFLHWAVGVSFTAVRAPLTLECPINVWKALAKTRNDYKKTNESDAVMIGTAVLELARGNGKQKT